ncbi:hypothetical protein L484_014902 [Morus notabilis]|uniref:Uncharacterized protein n=1 Tax=Morus notabilis TaxID=981085 RepID=W9R793_9ROSA|nr:hypothetical protein L484_014902 [Morus notabilis]
MDLENAYPINYDVGANNVFPHGPAVCRNRADRVDMNRFRDHLADQMWAAYTHPARDIDNLPPSLFMSTGQYGSAWNAQHNYQAGFEMRRRAETRISIQKTRHIQNRS